MAADTLDKVIVLTGASSGFGKGAARRLAAEGASLALAARRGELLAELADECVRLGGRAIAVTTDVARREEVERLCEEALRAFGRIDIWINDAGVGAVGLFERIPLEDHQRIIETNLLGTLYGSWHAYRHFVRRGEGTLINIASELGGHTVPFYSSYAAAKHGIVGLGDALRQEIQQAGHDKVHVCTVMPTAHDTPFFDHAANYSGHEIVPPRPLHDPANVVDTIVRLAHDPKDKEIVGADGVAKILMKKLVPGLEERAAARYMRRTQMDKAPPAEDTAGALHAPIARGTDVSGHRLEAG